MVAAGIDVWAFLDTSVRDVDQRIATRILAPAGVKVNSQRPFLSNTAAWRTFSSVRSGHSKPAFFRWAATRPEYTHFWHFEEDLAYTGDWGLLLRNLSAAHPHVDLLSGMEIATRAVGVLGHCRVAALKSSAADRCCLSDRCYLLKMYWPICRISTRFIQHVNGALSSGQAAGHHEAVPVPLCLSTSWCVAGTIDRHYYSNFSKLGGGTVVPHAFDVRHEPHTGLERGLISHPVKCVNATTTTTTRTTKVP